MVRLLCQVVPLTQFYGVTRARTRDKVGALPGVKNTPL